MRNARFSESSGRASRRTAELSPSRGPATSAHANIVVSNCVLRTTSTALKIGTESMNDIRNVVFAHCVVRDSHRAVGSIENVVVSNLVTETRLYPKIWWGAGEAIYVSAQARTPGGKIGTLRGLRFSHVLARGEPGVFIQGSPECIPEDIRLEDVTVTLAKTTAEPSRHDVRPPDPQGVARSRQKRGDRGLPPRRCTRRHVTRLHRAPGAERSHGLRPRVAHRARHRAAQRRLPRRARPTPAAPTAGRLPAINARSAVGLTATRRPGFAARRPPHSYLNHFVTICRAFASFGVSSAIILPSGPKTLKCGIERMPC